MRTQSYPSDLTDAQWPLIEPHLPVYPGGRPRTTNLRDVVDAVFYVLRTGCQWRYLPKDFPPKSTGTCSPWGTSSRPVAARAGAGDQATAAAGQLPDLLAGGGRVRGR